MIHNLALCIRYYVEESAEVYDEKFGVVRWDSWVPGATKCA